MSFGLMMSGQKCLLLKMSVRLYMVSTLSHLPHKKVVWKN